MHPFKMTLLGATLLAQGLSSAQTPPASSAQLLIRDGLTATDPQVASSLPRYLQWRSARFVDWLSDGSLLIATRFGDTLQIHRVRSPLGMREQLTFAPDGVIAAAARPAGSDELVYVTARSGEGTQLLLQQIADVVPAQAVLRSLTSQSEEVTMPSWAPDGARIAYVSRSHGAPDTSVYVVDTRTPGAAPRLLVAGNGGRWRIEGWSPDGRHLLLGRIMSSVAAGAVPGTVAGTAGSASSLDAADLAEGSGALAVATELYTMDVDSAMLTPVAPPSTGSARSRRARTTAALYGALPGGALPGGMLATTARFASDGVGLLLLTHEAGGSTASANREYLSLFYLDTNDGHSQLLSAPGTHDVRLFDESADGRYLAYTLEVNGASQLMLLDQRLKLNLPVASVPPGIIGSLKFDASGKRLAITLESTRSPADVYVLDVATGTLTRWTHSEVGLVDTQAFVQPQMLQFPTWDRVAGQDRQLSALGYSPGAEAIGSGAPRPVVIWLCSGAGEQCRPRFTPFVQYLVQELGCVVIAPQVRGSSGMGQSLREAGAGPLRDDAVRDIGALLVWIGLQPGLDHNRLALLGEGFGGYLALQSLTQYSDRLLGAVAAFPRTLTGLANVAAIRRPVLLVQALDDWNVPAYEVAQLREGLRAQGVAVQYLAAAGEGEDFTRRSTRYAYHLAAASFLAQLLR